MPWTAASAKSHTKKARNPKLAKQWADIANSILKKTGDDAKAIRTANGVIAKRFRKPKHG